MVRILCHKCRRMSYSPSRKNIICEDCKVLEIIALKSKNKNMMEEIKNEEETPTTPETSEGGEEVPEPTDEQDKDEEEKTDNEE